MPDVDESYPVNALPALAWALELYFKAGGHFKDGKTIELIFPVSDHKEMMRKKGVHEIFMFMSKRQLYLKARCNFDKECPFNSERINASDRDAVKTLAWGEADSKTFFKALRKWIQRLDLDFVTFIRALNTVCDRRVEIPLKTKYGRTFKKFDEYRRNKWPEDVTPDTREEFLEEVMVRVSFWMLSAHQVGALK
ncbi:MAG: hypothetical protein ACW98U_05690 [Candidatus Thorarchaeota archaeon]|jgi:hypothetical protein